MPNKKKVRNEQISKKLTAEEISEVEEYQSAKNTPLMQSYKKINQISIKIEGKNERQNELIRLINEKEMVICAGPAGTGKTYVSCACALDLLKKGNYSKILLVKSVTTLKDEDIGYLKGTLREKMEPFMYSFMFNFYKVIGEGTTRLLEEGKIIEILPIAYTRGCSIDNSIVLIDEVQNISLDNIRTIMTRIGSNSKFIFLGDTKQVDMKNKENSALKFIIDKFKHIEDIGIVEFSDDDVVRNPLIQKIEAVFNDEFKNS